jgi:hypothetical protein
MTFRASLVLLFTAAIVPTLTAPALMAKDTGCTNADFSGIYAFTVQGLIQPGLAISGDFGRLGHLVADGNGKATAVTIADYNGINSPETLPGPYRVSDNCYLYWTVPLPSVGGYAAFEGVISKGDGLIQVIVANPPGATLLGVMEKEPASCDAATLQGTYILKFAGPVEPGTPISGPFGRFGQIVFDGAGKATATTFASYNGLNDKEVLTGDYTVSAACHFRLPTTIPPPLSIPIVIEGEISNSGNHVLTLITSPPGAVIMGDFTKQ